MPILPSLPFSSRAMLARCMNHNKTVSSRNNAATLGKPKYQMASGVSALAMSAARGIAGGRSDGEPHDAEEQCRRPMESDKQANISGDPFAAFEFQPNRKEMTEERTECGRKRRISTVARHGEHGETALEHVAEQGRSGENLVARAQNVGCADIA